MTRNREQLRAVFLTALLIGSVFAAGIAFTGSAAAATNETIDPSDHTADATGVTYTLAANVELSSDQDMQYINVSLPSTDLTHVSASNISLYIRGSEYTDGFSSVNASGGMLNFTIDNSRTVTDGDRVRVVLENVTNPSTADSYNGTIELQTTTKGDTFESWSDRYQIGTDGTDQAPSLRKATHYVNTSGTNLVELAFSEDMYDVDASDITLYHEGEAVTSATVQDTGDDVGRVVITTTEVYKSDLTVSVSGVEDGDGTDLSVDNRSVTIATKTINTTNDGATFQSYVGTKVALEGNTGDTFDIQGPGTDLTRGTGVHSKVYVFNTKNRDTGSYNITNRNTGDVVTLELKDLGLEVSADADSFTTDEAVTATVTSDAINRNVSAALVDSDGNTVETQEARIDSDGVVTVDFGEQSAGNYTVVVTDVNTGVTAETSQFEVATAAAVSASFENGTTEVTRGDIATIDVTMTSTDTATVVIGSANSGYQANVTVVDDNGDGHVEFSINTYTMGGNAGAAADAFYVAGSSSDYVESVDLRFSDLSEPIASGNYRTSVRAGSDPAATANDIGRLYINPADGVTEHNIWTAPGSTTIENVVAQGTLSQDDTIAFGDYAVHEIRANGVFGVLQNASGSNASARLVNAVRSGELSLSVVQTDESTRQNRNPKRVNMLNSIENGNAVVVTDAANNTIYIVSDVDQLDYSRDPVVGNDVYNATFSLNPETKLVSQQSSASAEYKLVEETTEFVFDGDRITVEAAANQTISGETSLADGTKFRLLVESQTSPGEGYIISDIQTVAEDGQFTATVNFSDAAVNSTFEVTIEDTAGNTLDSAMGEVVEVTQPTTTQPTTTATTTQPTTTQPTTTQPTTTQPTTTAQQTTAQQTTAQQTTTPSGESGGGIPGFGMGIALIAIIGAAFLALREH